MVSPAQRGGHLKVLKKGQIVKRPVPVLESPNGMNTVVKYMQGVVIFVHPKGRFHTVEVEHGKGRKLNYTFYGVE